jgi:hypothetical protein
MNNWYELETLAKLKQQDLLREADAWRLAERARRGTDDRVWRRRLAATLRLVATWLSPGAAEPIVEIRVANERAAS